MEIVRLRALRGPNLWGRHTAIEALINCTDEECQITNLTGFETRLRSRFPQMGPLIASGHNEPLTLAHALEVVALGLQAAAGCPVTFSRTVQTPEKGTYITVVEYSEEAVGKLAFEHAMKLCQVALEDRMFDLDATLHELSELDEDLRLGPSTGSIVYAAVARGIPFRRMTEGSMVQLGWGSKQKRIQAAETSHTSAIAESIAQDKDLTKTLLYSAGVAVPQGRVVTTLEGALAAAEWIKGPVVVKPRDGNQGKGVAVNLQTTEQITAAFEVAYKISDEVIVERFLPGHDFRLLVVGNELVAAARRDPPYVIGDGQHTIRQLVDVINSDPQRSDGHATSLSKIRLDAIGLATLDEQGMTPESIPPRGVRINLRKNANLSTGGTATDVTDDVHPDLAAGAVAAAHMVGLDICGVDVVCDSVYKPLQEQGGGIVEVNAAPGLRMHLSPSYGKGRPVGEAIVRQMFATDDNGRIPVIAVSGTNGKTTTIRLTAHLIAQTGKRIGMTTTDGVYANGRLIDTGDCSGPRSARNVLGHPDVDAAVLETARGGILREGLGFDRCDVAIITNIGEGDHLGMNFINTAAELAAVKRVIVQNVSAEGTAVLNAADPLVARMARYCTGNVTFFAGQSAAHPVMAKHRAQGHRVIYRDNGEIIAAQGTAMFRLPLKDIPLTDNGQIAFQVENVMAAVGAAWALGIPWDAIIAGLASFNSDADTVPGRFNRFDYKGATLIADYGHNPDAIRALADTIHDMPAKRRSVVISAAGDRRDDDIRRQTRILGNVFDHVVLYEDACQRGRTEGEVVSLLREGLHEAHQVKEIDEIKGEFLAIDTALAKLQPGDICLILVDQVEEALAHIQQRIAEATH